jgi:hypothetical protein
LVGDNIGKTHEKSGGFFCFLIARSFRDFSVSSPEALLSTDGVCSGAIADTREELFGEVVIVVALRSSVVRGRLICFDASDEVGAGRENVIKYLTLKWWLWLLWYGSRDVSER